MKKLLLLPIALLCYFQADSQILTGTLVDSGRKLLTTGETFIIPSGADGTVVVEIAVNREGIVTGTKIIADQTTIKSTPSRMKAENAVKKLKFTAGTRYAPFEHVRVKYTYKVQ